MLKCFSACLDDVAHVCLNLISEVLGRHLCRELKPINLSVYLTDLLLQVVQFVFLLAALLDTMGVTVRSLIFVVLIGWLVLQAAFMGM